MLRKCIALSLGTTTTTGLDAAEIESRIMPLDLRREELAVREIVKIMSKNKNEEIVKCLNAFKNKTEDYHLLVRHSCRSATKFPIQESIQVQLNHSFPIFNIFNPPNNVLNTGITWDLPSPEV